MSAPEDDDAREEFISGPYCPHWYELGSGCPQVCVCSHTCFEHGAATGETCDVEGCACESFDDKENHA